MRRYKCIYYVLVYFSEKGHRNWKWKHYSV